LNYTRESAYSKSHDDRYARSANEAVVVHLAPQIHLVLKTGDPCRLEYHQAGDNKSVDKCLREHHQRQYRKIAALQLAHGNMFKAK